MLPHNMLLTLFFTAQSFELTVVNIIAVSVITTQSGDTDRSTFSAAVYLCKTEAGETHLERAKTKLMVVAASIH